MMITVLIVTVVALSVFFMNRSNYSNYTEEKKESTSIKKGDYQIKKVVNDVNYIGQTVFLNWADGKGIFSSDYYPQYFYYNYGIMDCNSFHKKMIDEFYLEKADIETCLATKTLKELKEILEENNQIKTGKKEDLIKRIVENIPKEKINTDNKKYKLSQKGKEYIEKYQYILDIKGSSISVEEFEKERAILSEKFSNRDVMWAIYNKYCLKLFSKKDFGLYRNNFLEMASFLYREKNNKLSLEYYLKVLCCDLSGMSNGNTIDDKSLIIIAPGIKERIIKLKECFCEELAIQAYQKTALPFNYCSEELFLEIVLEILNGNDKESFLEKYFPKMKKKPKNNTF